MFSVSSPSSAQYKGKGELYSIPVNQEGRKLDLMRRYLCSSLFLQSELAITRLKWQHVNNVCDKKQSLLLSELTSSLLSYSKRMHIFLWPSISTLPCIWQTVGNCVSLAMCITQICMNDWRHQNSYRRSALLHTRPFQCASRWGNCLSKPDLQVRCMLWCYGNSPQGRTRMEKGFKRFKNWYPSSNC